MVKARSAVTSAGKLFGMNTVTGEDGTPYMTRAWIGRLRLHVFHRPDLDDDCHDHPWNFWTFPIWPPRGYVEEVVEDTGWCEYEINGHRHTYSANSIEAQVSPLAAELGKPIYRKCLQFVYGYRLNFRPATHCHRVLGAIVLKDKVRVQYSFTESGDEFITGTNVVDPDRKIVTLVWRSGKQRPWGFLKNRDGKWCWIAWRDYVFAGGKDGPCQ